MQILAFADDTNKILDLFRTEIFFLKCHLLKFKFSSWIEA